MDGDGTRQAIGYLERAVQADPHSAALWMDLADAYEAAGNAAAARQAFARAQATYPISGEVAWRYGSLFLYEGDFPKGYAELKRALLLDPALAPSAVAECWQATPNVGALLDQALPAQPPYYLAALDFFLSGNLLDPALTVWNRALARGISMPMPQAVPLVNGLIGQNRLTEAERAWRQALLASRWPRDPGQAALLVFNGGFENEIVNGGFDWREIPAEGVTYARDSLVADSGSSSLRIDFSGRTNVDFRNVFQLVPVEPGGRYQFSAWLRTEGISTDQGIRFQIVDPQNPSAVLVLTPNTVGTNPWTFVQSVFSTGKDTHLLEIALRRLSSSKFDSKIRGTAWVDDVGLTPCESPAAGDVR